MSDSAPTIRRRLLLGFACGLGFAAVVWGTAGRGDRRGGVDRSAARPVEEDEARGKAGPSLAFARWLATSGAMGIDDLNPFADSAGPPAAAALAGRALEEADDELLFAAMERLERRMAAGMIRARESVVTLEYKAAQGPEGARRAATGVVVNARGDVVSVRIDRPVPAVGEPDDSAASTTRITARDVLGRRHKARWIAHDPDTGLTLLRIAPGLVRPIRPAAEPPALGGQVFVIGNPFGLGHSVSRGQVAGLDRTLEVRSTQINGLIQVQTPLFPGDSGAVVVNFRGQWLGLIRGGLANGSTDHAAATERGDDLGFAVPADAALWIADRLGARGRVDRAYLGVRLQPDADGPEPLDGAAVADVLPDTPAARGGLQIGDRIVSFDGRPTRSALELTERLDRTLASQAVRIEVVRGRPAGAAQRRAVWVETAPRPAPPPALAADPPAPKPTTEPVGLPASLPQAVADRIERLERRLEQLERPAAQPQPRPVETQASADRGRP